MSNVTDAVEEVVDLIEELGDPSNMSKKEYARFVRELLSEVRTLVNATDDPEETEDDEEEDEDED